MSNYKRVYFRIESNIKTDKEAEQFHTNVANLFLTNGWDIKESKYKSSHSCNTVIKDKQELYLHPFHFSGVVKEESISEIEHFLNNTDLLTFYKTDIYDNVFDMSDNEYINMLKSKQIEIENDILEIFKTKRRNLFITNDWTPLNNVLNKYKVKRLNSYVGVISGDDVDVVWITEVFKNLINQNKIISSSTRNGVGYRTATKKDVA